MKLKRKLSDTTIQKLLKTAIVLVDTREQENGHILAYLESHKIPYQVKKLDTGDYGLLLPKNDELGIYNDLELQTVVERKGSLDELISNMCKDRTRLENEFIRGQRMDMTLLIENATYSDIINQNYRSQMTPQSAAASLMTFRARYGFNIVFVSKAESGVFIYHTLYTAMRVALQQLEGA